MVHFSLEVFYYICMDMVKDLINRIKYRFSIENVSLNDIVVAFIICAYVLFFLMNCILPFRNLPMSFLLLTIILLALVIWSHKKNNYLESLLVRAKTRQYEEKKKQAQAAYKRYLKQQQERMNIEREQNRREYQNKEKKQEEKQENKYNSEKKDESESKNNRYSEYKKQEEYNDKEKKSKTDGTDKSDRRKENKNSDRQTKLDPVFFKNCTNIEQVEKTYKKLCQIYHPDQFTGDNDMFLSIKEEYEEIKKQF